MANVALQNRPPLENAIGMISTKTENPFEVRIVSAGSLSSGRTVLEKNERLQLRRENTYPGTAESLKKYPSVRFQAKSKSPNISKQVGTDQGIRVLRLRSEMKCFPLFQRNLNFAKDIEKKCREAIAYVNVPNSPGIFDQQELQLYIATDSVSEDFSQEVSAIMGDHAYSNKTDVTEKCFRGDFKRLTPDQDCSCLILFLHKEGTNITVHESANVLYVPSPSIDVEVSKQSQSVRVFREDTESPKSIRRKLTHILGEALFTYAEKVQQRLDKYEETNKSPNPDQKTMLRNIKEAVTVLLTRRVLPDRETSAAGGSTKHTIPDDIDSALNGMANRGVMAFGLFADNFIVFIDDKFSDQEQKQTTQEIQHLCNDGFAIKIHVIVKNTSKDFLTNTGLEQGHQLKQGSDVGSIGMVTNATVHPVAKKTTTESDGPTHSEQGIPKQIVVAITAGHLCNEHNGAFFFKNNNWEKFGKCFAKLYERGHISKMKYDIALIELDKDMTTNEYCSQRFRNEAGESCDGVLVNNSLKSGTLMYKKGAVTGMSEGVVVSSDFRRVRAAVNTEKGYLIKGRDDQDFAMRGDSGSIVFTLDTMDEENRTVNLASIVTQILSKELVEIPEIPGRLTYSVRLDKCLEELKRCNGVTVHMPKK